jgi:putative peptidoglycan lipid II flippase
VSRAGQDEHAERERFFGATRVVAGLTMLSRLLGLARDMANVAFGATRAMDSFWTAFRVPNVFRRLFGEGALSAAFVPVFTDTAEAAGWDRARQVLANVAGLLAVVLAALVALIELGLLAWLAVASPGADGQLLIHLTMIVLPFMFTICLLALGSAALNCKGHFAYPAFAPMLLNVALIAGAWVAHRLFAAGDWPGLFVLAAAVIAAGLGQLAGVVWLLRSVKLAALPRLRPVSAEARRIARLALPMMVPLGMTQISSLFDAFYAWFMTATSARPTLSLFGAEVARPLEEGVVTCLYAAERLYNFPLGILAISLATAVFPLLSRYAARRDLTGLRETTSRALRLSLFLGLPAGVALILLARPAIVLIYRHGRFTPADADRAAFILRMYCLGMWAYFCRHILLRAFFCQKDTATPLRVSCWMTLANMALVAVGVFTPLRAGAVGLATATTAAANVLVLAGVLSRRWSGLGGRSIAASLARTAGATAAMAAVVLGVLLALAAPAERLARAWDSPKAGAALLVAAAVPAGAAAFALVARLLRAPEVRELLSRPNRDAV